MAMLTPLKNVSFLYFQKIMYGYVSLFNKPIQGSLLTRDMHTRRKAYKL